MKQTEAIERIAKWDRGESVWSIEMGGLGTCYEQAIQVLAMEIIRDEYLNPLPEGDSWKTWGDKTVSRIDSSCGGFSGAQVGAAKQIAFRVLRDGEKAWGDAPADRKILVSNFWPRVAVAAVEHSQAEQAAAQAKLSEFLSQRPEIMQAAGLPSASPRGYRDALSLTGEVSSVSGAATTSRSSDAGLLLAELDRVRAERDAALATIAEWEPIMERVAGTPLMPTNMQIDARTALGSYQSKKAEEAAKS